VYSIVREWLDTCRRLRQSDFSPNYLIKNKINPAVRGGFLPINLEKLKIENSYLDNVLVDKTRIPNPNVSD
jgi:hypothetical protein